LLSKWSILQHYLKVGRSGPKGCSDLAEVS
jgi:hypothetical protein